MGDAESRRQSGGPLAKAALGTLATGGAYAALAAVRCRRSVRRARRRLDEYGARTAHLSYGAMTYLDEGEGEPLLSVHGLFGGYDQAFENVRDRLGSNRIVAPSRFGYLGSDVLREGTPADQAEAFVELLDVLGVEETYVLGASAGGTPAIRFALDHPERTKGLILYSSAPPSVAPPTKDPGYQASPPLLTSDYAMFLLNPFFQVAMGMSPETIHGMLPIADRRVGVDIDGRLTNPDMARNFADYPIEDLQVPTLILHARDDRVSKFAPMAAAAPRFPDLTFVAYDTGGHLMVGHETEGKATLDTFMGL